MAFLSGYTKRKAITIDNTYVDGTLTDFPLLVVFTDDAAIGADIDSNGYNLRFTSSDGTTELDYEREAFDNGGSTATGRYWVRVPSVSGTVDTVIYIYYKAASPSDGQDAANVWDSNFSGVWHLGESSGNALDSTSNANTLTDTNTVGAATGKVGGARDFEYDNREYLTRASTASLSFGDIDFTISAIVNLESKPSANYIRPIVTKDDGSDSTGRELYLVFDHTTDRFVNLVFRNGATAAAYANNLGSPPLSTWHHIIGRHNATADTVDIRVNDGTLDSAATGGALQGSGSGTFRIGGVHWNVGNDVIDALIDEVRVSKTFRSNDWCKFEYRNIFETDNEISLGSEETDGGTTGEEFQKHNPQSRRLNRRQQVPQFPAAILPGPSAGSGCDLLLEDGGGILTETAGDVLTLEGCPVANADQPESVLVLPNRRIIQAIPYQ